MRRRRFLFDSIIGTMAMHTGARSLWGKSMLDDLPDKDQLVLSYTQRLHLTEDATPSLDSIPNNSSLIDGIG